MEHHHWIYVISRSGSSWNIITGSGSSLDLDHHHWTGSRSTLDLDHHCWIIITGSRSSLDLDHPWYYLMILLITGSSTELALFHVGCRPTHHVGLRPALTSDLLIRKACPVLTSDLLVRKARPALTSDLLVRKAHPSRQEHILSQ